MFLLQEVVDNSQLDWEWAFQFESWQQETAERARSAILLRKEKKGGKKNNPSIFTYANRSCKVNKSVMDS